MDRQTGRYLVIDVMKIALNQRDIPAIDHSDHDPQYTCDDFRELLRKLGIERSMSGGEVATIKTQGIISVYLAITIGFSGTVFYCCVRTIESVINQFYNTKQLLSYPEYLLTGDSTVFL